MTSKAEEVRRELERIADAERRAQEFRDSIKDAWVDATRPLLDGR